MNLICHYPKFRHGVNPPAVYRMDLDTGQFYIGSSKAIKMRMGAWKTVLKSGKIASKTIVDALNKATEVRFSILEYPPIQDLLCCEERHIKQYFDNPLLLNRCPFGTNNVAMKPLPSHLVIEKKDQYRPAYVRKGRFKPPPGHVYAGSVKVHRFTPSGIFDGAFNSIAEGAKSVSNGKSNGIQKVLKGERKTYKGFVWKYASAVT